MTYVQLSYLNSLIGLGKGEYMSLGIMLDRLENAGSFADSLYTSMKGMGINLFDRAEKQQNGTTTPFEMMLRQQSEENGAVLNIGSIRSTTFSPLRNRLLLRSIQAAQSCLLCSLQ